MSGKELVWQKVKVGLTMEGDFIEEKGYGRTNWGERSNFSAIQNGPASKKVETK
ncbi:MAG: hypothetical protein AAFR87_29325 [Bacteroidota bacterium]